MKAEQAEKNNLWTMVTAGMAILLFLNFLAFGILCLIGIGLALDPSAGIVAALLILLGFGVGFFARRKGAAKLWRRILTAAVGCNFLIIAFHCGAAILLISYIS